uniref:Uncharacterized protein n=1 Tax=Pyrodinium bahamense TaxID=73915 RepID=A0A7S0AAN2_9DINO|mmetsp:Transcript_29655/g.81620  ORF Transcript_29655/g.81620 Transcript_29655/m.81620 type:complete len:124 (+) Transcript_29655:81-452(+)|eukprot:CAMPEP_0179079634 /NCGR_PEP_ID=MMETSP0796-20121207/35743_1 /TAXON_ID=73915 /ORGANISM="Pyrodinium bahamense, Strain pbaha01" /LENGTH=123 /DNA_ID=CAMNT_0020776975 /DNA_START=81 /DNA_END=452 /DNA_ORIENTATION=+
MAAKQIEGSAAKPSFLTRIGTMFANTAKNNLRPGAGIYSLGYGIAAGVVLSGLVYAGRTLHILCFDHDYYKLQSRKRYYEKQLLFSREQEEVADGHYLAALSAEYDPAATRMPFKPLEAKYRF